MTEEEKLELEEEKREEQEEKKEKQKKKKAKEAKSFERLKKAFWVLFVLYIFLFVIWSAINKYLLYPRSIYSKIGQSTSGTSIPLNEAYKIEIYAIESFADYLREGKYEEAYNMCCREYKNYKSLEDFTEYAKTIDADTIRMKEIKAKSNYALEAQIVYKSGEETVDTIYMIYPDEFKQGVYYLSPDKFLYRYVDQDFKKDGISIHIDECIAYVDRIILKGTVKNDSLFDEVNLTEICASYEGTLNKWQKFEKNLKKGEEAKIDLLFEDLHFFVPNGILLRRQKDENTLRTYEFSFKDDKKRS